MKIIETNYHNERDFQSRIIEVDSWYQYINHYINYKGEATGDYNNSIYRGYVLPKNAKIDSLKYDDNKLMCTITCWNNNKIIRLACISND